MHLKTHETYTKNSIAYIIHLRLLLQCAPFLKFNPNPNTSRDEMKGYRAILALDVMFGEGGRTEANLFISYY
jgi:hypothetical protein